MENGDERSRGPRCSAMNKAGERCGALAGSDGKCSAHRDPERMRELGRLSAKARSQPNPARIHPSLRQYLRENVAPSEVWAALKLALESENQSAKVNAARTLMDALAEPARGCPKCAEREANGPQVEAKLIELLTRHEPEREAKLRAIVHEELAAVAEHVDVAQVEEQLVARL